MNACAMVTEPGRDIESGIENITVQDKPDDGFVLGDYQVVVKVRSCCVNYPDLLQVS